MKEESNQSPDGDYIFLYVVSWFPSSKLTVGEQDSEASMYWWYRNTNFNSLNMLTTMFKKMVFVDTSIYAKRGKNVLKCAKMDGKLYNRAKSATLHLRVGVGPFGVTTVNVPCFSNSKSPSPSWGPTWNCLAPFPEWSWDFFGEMGPK